MQITVKAHTRKLKNGTTMYVPSHTRYYSKEGMRRGTHSPYLKKIHDVYMTKEQQAHAIQKGHVVAGDNIFSYDHKKQDFYVTPSMGNIVKTKGIVKDKNFRVYLKENKRENIRKLLSQE